MRKRTKQRATKKPAVSVVIVSDYASGGTTAWNDVRATLRALAIQNFKEPVEFILSENTEYKKQIPRDLTKILPSLKTILSSAASSYGLKNEGVRAAAADIVALIDADCVPGADWLQRLVDVMRNNPSVAAVSGRTTYAGRNFLERAMALLSRSYLDPGRAGSTRYISNNNAAYRRTVYLAHPLPIGVSPFAARMQAEAILRDGGRLLFEPRMHVIHNYDGWAMEGDIRRNAGYGTVAIRFHDQTLPYAWLVRMGYASIPFFFAGLVLKSWWDCFRCNSQYGIRWHELPAALGLAVVVNIMEIPGMLRALSGGEITETAYR